MSCSMATIVGMNAMIGASIFVIPSALQATVGPAVLFTYAAVVFGVWCMARALAEVARLYPSNSAFFDYAAAWGGKKAGIIATLSYIIGLTIAMGLLTKIVGLYLTASIPKLSAIAWGLTSLSLMGLALSAGAAITSLGQLVLIAMTIIPMVIIAILCISRASIANLFPLLPYGFSSIISSVPKIIFGFFGFEAIPALFSEVRDPEKNVPRALTASVLLVGLVYMTFIAAIVLGLPRELFGDGSISLAQVLATTFPQHQWLIQGIQGAIIGTILGTLHAMIWAVSTLLRSFLIQTKSSIRVTPIASVWIVIVGIALATISFSSIDLFFNITALPIVMAYAAAIMALTFGPRPVPRHIKKIAWAGLTTASIIALCACLGILRLMQ